MTRWIVYAIAALLTLGTAAWATLALWYQMPGGVASRWAASVLWVAWTVALLILVGIKRSSWPFAGYALTFFLLLGWWSTIRPSQHRRWSEDVAQTLTGSVDGQRVTLQHVRDFNWRAEHDYDVRWETRTYDLHQLDTADVILSYWGMPAIAHAMVSFGFNDGRHLVFSVEIRKRRGDAYSVLGGFFKRYESAIVAADEHDIIRVRTNVRGEDDYLYPLRISQADMRALFVAYVEQANQLARVPAFYNTVTSNCITVVYRMARQIDPGLPLDYRLLLTGWLPSYLYQVHALDTSVPLPVLIERARITPRALATTPGDDFSKAIRAAPRSLNDSAPSP